MALLSWRTFTNKSGTSYDALATTKPFAEDLNKITACFVDASTEIRARFQNVTTAERNALTPHVGLLVYNTDNSRLEVYTGAWSGVGGGGSTVRREDKRGSNCSGTDGQQNRILTLANTSLSANEEIRVQGLFLHSDQYTINHLSANSTITLLDPTWDEMYITVTYTTS
jgi:hypothetical protein